MAHVTTDKSKGLLQITVSVDKAELKPTPASLYTLQQEKDNVTTKTDDLTEKQTETDPLLESIISHSLDMDDMMETQPTRELNVAEKQLTREQNVTDKQPTREHSVADKQLTREQILSVIKPKHGQDKSERQATYQQDRIRKSTRSRVDKIEDHYNTCRLRNISPCHDVLCSRTRSDVIHTHTRYDVTDQMDISQPVRPLAYRGSNVEYPSGSILDKRNVPFRRTPIQTQPGKCITESPYGSLMRDLVILEHLMKQCREILHKYGRVPDANPSPVMTPRRALDYHRRVLVRDHDRLDEVDEVLQECRDILNTAKVRVPDVAPQSVRADRQIVHTRPAISQIKRHIELETEHLGIRDLVQYLYATYPPDIVFVPHVGGMLDQSDLTRCLKEAIISYNPLWQKRYDNRWRETCIHIRDVLIGRQRGLLFERGLENSGRWRMDARHMLPSNWLT